MSKPVGLAHRTLALALTLAACGACRVTPGYHTAPLTSSNQFPPPPRSVEHSNDATHVAAPPGGVPGERAPGGHAASTTPCCRPGACGDANGSRAGATCGGLCRQCEHDVASGSGGASTRR